MTQPTDPQLITHKKLKDEVLHLEAAIRRYVDNYLSQATTTQVDLALRHNSQLSQLATHNENWQELFLDSAKQYSAWRMFIARVISVRIDKNGPTNVTLLPAEILNRYQSLVGGHKSSK